MILSRRRFLRGTAAGAAALALPLSFRARAYAANDSIRVAVIGLNGRGKSHLAGFASNLVALCDVDRTVLAASAKMFEKGVAFSPDDFAPGTKGDARVRIGRRKVDLVTDFRRLLDRQDIDAVSIATPNHTHAWIGILAAQAGKDVYVEKPVSHNVWEGRQLVNAARRYHRIIQSGTQSRSSPSLKAAVAWVRDGNLGKILYAVGTCYKPRKSIGKLDKPLAIPSTVDYDLWCGPAAEVDLYRPKLHYDWHWDFNTGNGDMGNQGIHQVDIARWFLGELTLAPKVLSIGGRFGYSDAGNTPNTQIVYHAYEKAPLIFETRGLPKSKAAQKNWKASMDTYRGSQIGVLVQCERGHVLIPSYTSAIAYDKEGRQIKRFDGGGDHYANFLAAVRSRKNEELNGEILDGHLSSAMCHVGNISHRLGAAKPAREIAASVESIPLVADAFQRMSAHLSANEVDVQQSVVTLGPMLEMDVATERFTNNETADRMLKRHDVRPFAVPEVRLG